MIRCPVNSCDPYFCTRCVGTLGAPRFDGAPIDLDKMYKIVLPNDSAARGKYGYSFLGEAERIVDDEYGMLLQDAIVFHCKRHKGEKLPELGRITIKAA